MTPLDYAKLCAARYQNVAVKGRGHAPRIPIDRHHEFQKLIPHTKVHERDDDGAYSVIWYAARSTYNHFSDDLLAAGIDIITGNIVSETHWLAAQVLVRLTGEPYDHLATLTIAAEVRALIEDRADRDLNRALRSSEL